MAEIKGDGESSHGQGGRWSAVLDARNGAWSLFDRSGGQATIVTYGATAQDLADLAYAITTCLGGTA